MNQEPIVVSITGSAGQIAYSLLPRLASGEVFGKNQSIHLKLIETENSVNKLEGIIMELKDCAFPCLEKITATSDLNEGFDKANWALLIGALPRREGMERKDLLEINGKIFNVQGKAIADNAAEDIRVLVIGNPCNTNCLIAIKNAQAKIPANRFFAMSRLDENRAKTLLAEKAKTSVEEVSNMTIWGNHSSTQYPDFTNAKIQGFPATEKITDRKWLENTFIQKVQERGAEVIKARGASSAFSAANSILDTIKFLISPTRKGDWHSVCVLCSGEYGFPKDLVISLPVYTENGKEWKVVEGLERDDFSQKKVSQSIDELKEEKRMIQYLL